MLFGRRSHLRTVAFLLPVNMLWVLVACTLQCMAASEAGCADEHERPAVHLQVSESETQAADLEGADAVECQIASTQPAVLANGSPHRAGLAGPAVVPALVFLPISVAPARDVPPRSAGPPPLGRPLDRLPVLLI